MFKTNKVYIAGHSGLIGSAVVSEANRRGYENVVYKDHSELELKDRRQVEKFFEEQRPDIVILAAGKVGGIAQNQLAPADFMIENLTIQLNVIECAHCFNVDKLIFIGSSCMYPRDCRQPMSEDMILSSIPESSSLPYAISKIAGVNLCAAFNKQYGRKYISVIPNSVYGARDNFNPESAHVLSSLIHRFHEAKVSNSESVVLWGDGGSKREFVYSDDVAKAIFTILENIENLDAKLPINIGSGVEFSIKDLAQAISGVVGYSGNIVWDKSKPNGAPRKLLDSSKLKEIGWKPEMNFLNGLAETYNWYIRNC